MAAARQKKRVLMPEEKLDEALIPNTEEPYSVPLNWCWTKMGVVAKWGSGGTPSRKNDDYYNGTIPWVKTGELNDDFIWETEEHISEQAIADSSAKLFPINTIIIAMYGATIGKVGILGLEATTNQACACGVSSAVLLYKYLFYYARSQKEAFIGMGKGGAQPNISQEIIKEHPIPLPPLTEQQRIVDRIESLFTKLDEAKEKAQAVVDGFEDRKAAILHKAFTGKLSEEWRKSHPHKPWSTKPWGDFISTIEAGKNWKAEERPPKDNEFGIVKVSAVTWGHFDEYESKTCFDSSQWNPKTQIREGDFLFSRANTIQLVGNCVIVDQITKRLMLSDKILRYNFVSSVNQHFILYYTRSRLYRKQVEQLASGNQEGMRNISQNNVKRIQFPIPSIEEQNEIVKILDEYFSQAHEANEMAKNVIDQIETIKKSILARAFRSELGTNDPNDESAIELLKKVLTVETTPQHRKKGVALPKEISEELKTELERKILKLFIQRETDSLPIRDLMSVSSKPFEVLETLHDLEKRQIIKSEENNSNAYKLMR